MLKRLLFALVLVLASGCIGESWSRHNSEPSCERSLRVCLRGDCYYCAEASLTSAHGCVESEWVYRDGTDPQDKMREREVDVIRYGDDAVVTITEMPLACASSKK
jgi:hypothetical protein